MNVVRGRLRRYAGEGTRLRSAIIFIAVWAGFIWLASPVGQGKAWDTWQFAAIKTVLSAGLALVVFATVLRRLAGVGLTAWTLEVDDKTVRAKGVTGRTKVVIDLTKPYSSLLISDDERSRLFVKLTQNKPGGRAKLVLVTELDESLDVEPDAVWNGPRLYRPKVGVSASPMKLKGNTEEPIEGLIAALLKNNRGDEEPWHLDLPYPFREAEIFPDGLTVVTEGGTKAVYPLTGTYRLAAKARKVAARLGGRVREWAEVTVAVLPESGEEPLIVGFAGNAHLASILPDEWSPRPVPITRAWEVDRTVELDEMSWSRAETLVFLKALSGVFAAGGAEELARELATPDALIFRSG